MVVLDGASNQSTEGRKEEIIRTSSICNNRGVVILSINAPILIAILKKVHVSVPI